MPQDRHAEAAWRNHIATATVQGFGALASIAPAPRRARPGLSVIRTCQPSRTGRGIAVLGVLAVAVALFL